MRITLIGTDPESNPTGSAAVYRTDQGSWIVQGRPVTAPDVLEQMNVPAGDIAVEIPDRMVHFLEQKSGNGHNGPGCAVPPGTSKDDSAP